MEYERNSQGLALGDRPLLLLDVDGVLFPLADEAPTPYRPLTVWGFDVFVNDLHKTWLAGLLEVFEPVWATTWEHNAVHHVGPVYGLPPTMPVIEFPSTRQADLWKVSAIEQFCADRTIAWVDDDPTPAAFAWVNDREAPTLLLRPDPKVGLEKDHVRQLLEFAEASSPKGK